LLGFSQSQFFGLRAQLSREIIHFSSWEQERTGQEFLFTALLTFFCCSSIFCLSSSESGSGDSRR
jgi:hypothetical protein